jgi:hypothetical protein
MNAQDTKSSLAEVSAGVSTGMAGLGIVTFALFPLTVPGLMLFVIAPLVLLAIVGAVLVMPVVLAIWLGRMILRSRSRNRARDVPATGQIPGHATWPTAATR